MRHALWVSLDGPDVTFDALIIQALSLSERERYAVKLPSLSDFSPQVECCKQWFDPGNCERPQWAQFLKKIPLGEKRLAALAHPTTFCSRARPAWAITLRSLMHSLQSSSSRWRNGDSLAESLASPVVGWAWGRLVDSSSASQLQLLSLFAQRALRKSLTNRLKRTMFQVANWEGKDGEQFFEEDIESRLFYLLQQYPALARLWSQQVRNWIEFVKDFLHDAERFLRKIDRDQLGAIRSIVPDISDPHRGNRTVLRVQFLRGGAWYYKPRSGAAEHGWSRLLDWLNKDGFPRRFKTPKIVLRKDHCWMEAIPVRACRSGREAATFFSNAGALLYLIQILRGCDFHAGNLIPHGSQVVVIDCETLRHPVTRLPSAARFYEKDVLGTGLLPAAAMGTEVSVFGRFLDPSQFRTGQPVLAHDLAEELISGFTAMHEFIRDRKNEFRAAVRRFFPDDCRCIYRPTAYYEQILTSSLAPRVLVSGFARSLLLHASCRAGTVRHPYVDQEVEALENADIPHFQGKASSIRGIPNETTLSASVKMIRNALRRPEPS